jgi:hypothetical protein
MRTISLSLVRDAVADVGDWQSLALAIAADRRTMDWPNVIIRDLFRIGLSGASSPVDIAKLKTCLEKLETTHA